MDEQLTDKLTDKQVRIIQRVARGETWLSAALAEGCRVSYARVIRSRLMRKPAAVKEIEASQAALREKTLFTQEQASKRIDEQIKGALGAKSPNHMAAAKLLELQCKIHGLLIDEIHLKTENLDLKGAMTEARGRVFSIVDIRSERSHDSLAASKVLTAAAQSDDNDKVPSE